MPLLDIATVRSVFQNDVCAVKSQILFCSRFNSWKSFCILGKPQTFGGIKVYRGGLMMIRAVATLEKESTKANHINQDSGIYPSSIDSRSSTCSVNESSELDESEKLRRIRISKANKGKTPWNKGRKHSPETVQKIRERTRIAMQDPKVRMKLRNFGHAQSKGTRLKIGVGVRVGWGKRQKMLKRQEKCYYEWQNLIAEASKKGFFGEEELEWESYEVLDRELGEEWLESFEKRKASRGSEANSRAPKSADQRRKIAEAISAKWADPDYRTRVCSALAKYHGIRDGVERKPRNDGQPRRIRLPKKKNNIDGVAAYNPKQEIEQVRLKRSYKPKYKDPLASSKLDLLINIRSQRAVVDNNKKIEAVKRARLLIAEAEKAADALEIAAMKSSVARASLVETRGLIAEAIQSMNSIDMEDQMLKFHETTNFDDSENAEIEDLDEFDIRELNTSYAIHSLKFTKHASHGLLNGNGGAVFSSSGDYDLLGCKKKLHQAVSGGTAPPPVEELPNKTTFHHETLMGSSTTATKQWICGRLVEVAREG